ncbi:MAG: hypothetical protein QXT67_09055 [Candidatus Bathyarchaeia archaeon]
MVDFDQEVLHLRDELLRLVEEISAKYGGRSGGKRVINLLMDHICERCIIEKIKSPDDGDDDVDRIWRNMHSYAVTLLIERLKNELAAAGLPISIISEAENPSGRYDILLMVDRKGVQVLNRGENISVEVKTGLNISLSQTEKYMWNSTTMILVRFATGDAITLRAGDWADLLKMALRNRIEKANRILDGKVILVPGRDCHECPLKECRFNRKSEKSGLTRPHDINELFDGFRRNACAAIENAVKAVMTELVRELGRNLSASGVKELREG